MNRADAAPRSSRGADIPPAQKWWICSSCLAVYVGDDKQASRHFDQAESWSHWLYEFTWSNNGVWQPTGHEIHTSDTGGYYLSDAQPLEWVWQSFARSAILAAVRDKFPAQ